jgi:hypothetical protein
MDNMGPGVPPSGGSRSWPVVVIGLLVTGGLVAALIALWPAGGDGEVATADPQTSATPFPVDGTTTTGKGKGEPSQTTSTVAAPRAPGDLFGGDLPEAYGALLAAAGGPQEVIEVAIYDTYAFLAYRDPADPGNIDRRMWRDGVVDDADANPIDDRVDADTQPKLFAPTEVDPGLIPALVADAPTRYSVPTAVTHVLITRFLPFDERVLIRVYASPTDGRSGGGYVSYDTAGTFVRVCC